VLAALAYAFWLSASFKEVAAGVAVFVFGMFCMDEGFRAFSGGTLERVLSASTDRLWKSLGFGIATTTLMQSSSLVSVITISFLSAGLIGLAQGIGIIFGANLGTTTGAWIVAGFGLKVNIAAYALPLLVFGVILMTQKSKPLRGLGWILAGLGFLFLGIHYMKEGFASYADTIDLTAYAVPGIAGLLLFTLIGILATVVMQSSHATLVLVITALGAGQITYENGLALAIGSNVGTTITAIIGSLNAGIGGKRLAGAHLIFNVTTGLIALLLIQPLVAAVDTISNGLGIAAGDYTLRLAVFHTLFNLIGVALMTPLIGRLVRFLETSLKERRPLRDGPRYLSDAALELPRIALHALLQETRHLFRNAYTLIAHGVSLRRADIASDRDLSELLDDPGKTIELDVDEQYELTIKDIYSANVDFLTRAQAKAPPEMGERYQALWRANLDVAGAIKAMKHLRKNLLRYMRSGNPHIRREYNRLRVRVGEVLRALQTLQAEDEGTVALLSLDDVRVEILQADKRIRATVDRLIREAAISPQMATSLMNDSVYATEIMERLVAMTEALYAAASPEKDEQLVDLSLQPEDLEGLAERLNADATAAPEPGGPHEDGQAAR
jgi:phosphate:Na+ symporter